MTYNLDMVSKSICDFILPFSNNQFSISQGNHGPLSHYARKRHIFVYDDSYSVDFALPVGSEILAAKSGRIDWIDINTECYFGLDSDVGFKTKCNFIVIRHEDYSFAVYAHIGKVAPNLNNSEFVEQGSLIGYTGLSGWIGNTPHLHFACYQFGKSIRCTIPVSFKDYSGSLEHSKIDLEKIILR